MPGGRLPRTATAMRSRSWSGLAFTEVLGTIVIAWDHRGQRNRLPSLPPDYSLVVAPAGEEWL